LSKVLKSKELWKQKSLDSYSKLVIDLKSTTKGVASMSIIIKSLQIDVVDICAANLLRLL